MKKLIYKNSGILDSVLAYNLLIPSQGDGFINLTPETNASNSFFRPDIRANGPLNFKQYRTFFYEIVLKEAAVHTEYVLNYTYNTIDASNVSDAGAPLVFTSIANEWMTIKGQYSSEDKSLSFCPLMCVTVRELAETAQLKSVTIYGESRNSNSGNFTLASNNYGKFDTQRWG